MSQPAEEVAGRLRATLERALARDRLARGTVLLVEGPGLRWEAASGLADPATGAPMTPRHPFRAASITKAFTAAACLALRDAGELDLDAGIGRYLPAEDLRGLHVYGGREHGAAITLRQLLGHTSGVADFFGDGDPGPDGGPPFLRLVLAEPERLWEPREVLAWTKASLSARFPPGAGWHYSDTGYLVAGLILERACGKPLHDVLRERILAPLDLASTYMVFREPAPTGAAAEAHAFVGELDYSRLRSVSADWASGGLVTTATDLNRFLRGLVEGRLLGSSSMAEMRTWRPTGERGVHYGLGLRRFVLDELGLPGRGDVWGHTGFLRTFMLHWPQRDVSICGTLDQALAAGAWSELRPVAAIVPELVQALDQAPNATS